MRFSLKWLIALTLVSGLWLYAVLFPYSCFIPYAFTAVVVAVMAGSALILASRNKTFWAAFTIATVLYAALTLLPVTFDSTRSYVLTDLVLQRYAKHLGEKITAQNNDYWTRLAFARKNNLPPPEVDVVMGWDRRPIDASVEELIPKSASQSEASLSWNLNNILFIGHGYFALVAGVIAGFFAQWIQRRAKATEKSAAESGPS